MPYLRYRDRISSLLLILFLIGLCIPLEARAVDTPSRNTQKISQNRLPPAGPSLKLANSVSPLEVQTYTDIQKAILNHMKTGNGSIKSAKGAIPLRERFYAERRFQPAWIRDKKVSDQAQKLLQISLEGSVG